jgi:hypothetical protein
MNTDVREALPHAGNTNRSTRVFVRSEYRVEIEAMRYNTHVVIDMDILEVA